MGRQQSWTKQGNKLEQGTSQKKKKGSCALAFDWPGWGRSAAGIFEAVPPRRSTGGGRGVGSRGGCQRRRRRRAHQQLELLDLLLQPFHLGLGVLGLLPDDRRGHRKVVDLRAVRLATKWQRRAHRLVLVLVLVLVRELVLLWVVGMPRETRVHRLKRTARGWQARLARRAAILPGLVPVARCGSLIVRSGVRLRANEPCAAGRAEARFGLVVAVAVAVAVALCVAPAVAVAAVVCGDAPGRRGPVAVAAGGHALLLLLLLLLLVRRIAEWVRVAGALVRAAHVGSRVWLPTAEHVGRGRLVPLGRGRLPPLRGMRLRLRLRLRRILLLLLLRLRRILLLRRRRWRLLLELWSVAVRVVKVRRGRVL